MHEPVATYAYRSAVGQVLYEVVRFPGKEFRIRRPDDRGSSWTWDLDGVERVPYRLEEVALADQVALVEGEKDAESLRSLDIVASTNVGGVGGWRDDYARYFAGKHVIVIPDCDAPGQAWAEHVLRDLHGVAASLKLIELPGLEPGSGQDVTDWLEAGHTKRELLSLIEAALLWTSCPGEKLLRELEDFLHRFVVLPRGALLPLALWTIGTHCFELFDTFPYLIPCSPLPRCGKTRLLRVLGLLCARPEHTANVSEAVLFRLVEETRPTLLLDEAEALREKTDRSQVLRNLLNAGNQRGTGAIRCTEGGKGIARFDVYCPKSIALIGNAPETLRDRGIVLRMQRRLPSEPLERFLFQRVKPEAEDLRSRLAESTTAASAAIARAYADMPDLDFLNDRDTEHWASLFSLLSVFDSSRLVELRAAAEGLCGEKDDDAADDSLTLRLLHDLDEILEELDGGVLLTNGILSRLRAREDSPWNGEVELSPHKLARWLRPLGVKPRKYRQGNQTLRGYERSELMAAISRYKGGQVATTATRNLFNDLGAGDVAVVADRIADGPATSANKGPSQQVENKGCGGCGG